MSNVLMVPDLPGRGTSAWMRSWVKKFTIGKVVETESFVTGDEELWISAILHSLELLPEPRHLVAEGLGATAAALALSGSGAVPVDTVFFLCPELGTDPWVPQGTIRGLSVFPTSSITCEVLFVCKKSASEVLQKRTLAQARQWSAVFTLLKDRSGDLDWEEGLRLFHFFCLREDSCIA